MYTRKPSLRHPEHNYSEHGYYFVTICVKDMECCLGNVIAGGMQLNKTGLIVKKQLLWVEQHFDHVTLDEWIIMPNHVHAIIIIDSSMYSGRLASRPYRHKNIINATVGVPREAPGHDAPVKKQKIKPLSQVIGAFKTTSTKIIRKTTNPAFQWQRNYYDHIIRNERSLYNIRSYIRNNPANWHQDEKNPINSRGAIHRTHQSDKKQGHITNH